MQPSFLLPPFQFSWHPRLLIVAILEPKLFSVAFIEAMRLLCVANEEGLSLCNPSELEVGTTVMRDLSFFAPSMDYCAIVRSGNIQKNKLVFML